MLRSFAASGSAAQASIAEQHVQRSALLQQKRTQLATSQVLVSLLDAATLPEPRVRPACLQRAKLINVLHIITKLVSDCFVASTHLQPPRIGASELASSILGPWERAPKAGRDAYERYLAAVSALLGGEASAGEVQAAAAAAWPVLQRLPPAEQLRGRGSATALEPIRYVPVARCNMT